MPNNTAESAKAKEHLARGQVAFAPIVVSDNWLGADGGQGAHRPIYDVKRESPAAAKADIGRLR